MPEASSGHPPTGAPPYRLPGRLRTALVLLAIQGALRLVGFRRVRSALEPAARNDGRHLTPDEAAYARALARRIERAAGFRIYRVPCLARALLLRRWLARRGLPARLRIGVRRDGERSGGDPLHAHAWIESGDLVLDPDERVGERFGPLE